MTASHRVLAALAAVAITAMACASAATTPPVPTLAATSGSSVVPAPTSNAMPGAATPASSPPTPSIADYSTLKGRILMEHLGNAPDLSEANTSDIHPGRRRLYFMDPADMTSRTVREFLPGKPAGKLSADVSTDGRKVVFEDTSAQAQIWEANVDETGLHRVTTTCDCSEYDPAYDPTARRIAFVHVEGAMRSSEHGANGHLELTAGPRVSWLGIRDLASGKVTKLAQTVGTSADAIPEQPSWSPDGTKIVFNRSTWGTGDAPTSGVLQIADVASGNVTTLPRVGGLVPGDADWSPDGTTILLTNGPMSSTGSIEDVNHDTFTVHPDGTGFTELPGCVGASYMSDGRVICQGDFFWIMNADGSDLRPVNVHGMDLTDLDVGFGYIAHWIPNP